MPSNGTDNPQQARRPKRSDGLRTIEKVLKAAEAEMNEHGFVKFNLDRVIEKAEVSRSSVYHHFGGRDGLIAAVETVTVVKSLGAGLAEMEALLDSYSSGEEAFRLIELGIRISGSPEQRATRRRRISSLSAAQSSPAIRQMLADTQRSGTAHFARIIEKLRDRGLCSPVGPVDGLAHLIQSTLVGRVLVDVIEDPELERAWEESAVLMLRQMLRPSP